MGYKQKPEVALATEQRILAKIEANGHVYLEGKYYNRDSKLLVWCPTHENEQPTKPTTFYNYDRCRTGLPCCGRESASKKLQNRQFSEESIVKMQQSALNRPPRGGKPRRWRETAQYRNWRAQVIQDFNEECAVTGVRKVDTGDLEVHHLNSANDFPQQVLVVENGILIHKEIHKQYHLQFGYGKNTVEQFQEFLLNLIKQTPIGDELSGGSKPISSQANSEGLEGSETRAYDPERVMKLHERLERIKVFLISESEIDQQ